MIFFWTGLPVNGKHKSFFCQWETGYLILECSHLVEVEFGILKYAKRNNIG